MKEGPTPSAKLGRWLGYSGMATAFLAVSTKAGAQIVVIDPEPDVSLINDGLSVDFDSDGITDLHINHNIYVGSSSSVAQAKVNMYGGALMGQILGGPVYPSVVASGAVIAPGDPDFQSGSGTAILANKINVFASFYAVDGNWNGQSGFLGCRFMGGDGAIHYGWVQLSVSAGITSITVPAFGYETMPDMAIIAGDMGLTTGVADVNAHALDMDITPNPTSDNAQVHFPNTGSGNMRVSLLNGTGQTLFTDAVGNADNYALNLADYAKGVYFVRLQDGKRVAFRKVVKQ